MLKAAKTSAEMVHGEYIDFDGERYYAIRDVNRMSPFLISLISADDHWLFASSNGGLTAGRVSPATMLFPYIPADKVHFASFHTGSLTLIRILRDEKWHQWEPFGPSNNGQPRTRRNLYKNLLGNKLCFEEVNEDLHIAFRYTWQTSDRYGFVRQCALQNLSDTEIEVDLADGLQNILPAGTPSFAQTNSSNLVDAYKWTELDRNSGLVLFTLYSGITDRAEPCESLKANVAYCIGLEQAKILISTDQLRGFRRGDDLQELTLTRGVRGAIIANAAISLSAGETRQWRIVADTELTQPQVVRLGYELADREALAESMDQSILRGSDALARIMARTDGFQATAEENVATHHYANVAFNTLRGGIFNDQYTISTKDLRQMLRSFNRTVFARNQNFLEQLPDSLQLRELLQQVSQSEDPQLHRLCLEYLPITFGRRHGDPSRPWNKFAIRLRDSEGEPIIAYEGNWRDIFQNWEALAFSYPEFVEAMIAKFVNASTIDGYNPYRITNEGIDWEIEDPDDPWSYIGYWGDHQIIYLLKLLELSQAFHPDRLASLLREPIFCYANVPYCILPFDQLLADSKNTVEYDEALGKQIEELTNEIGADGKLVHDHEGEVYRVNLTEKLLVPLLAKLGNLVIDGGIWMNTQRPEWNDANNALVGHGLSMVTLNYLRRYISFLDDLLASDAGEIELSVELTQWLTESAKALEKITPRLGRKPLDPDLRLSTLRALGIAASKYRLNLYEKRKFSGKTQFSLGEIRSLFKYAITAIDHSIATNKREDGLYHAYNLLNLAEDGVRIDRLYPMLEGQVSTLSAGFMSPDEVIRNIESIYRSQIYRPDQDSFMLYPDRELPRFLEKNRIAAEAVHEIPLLSQMLDNDDSRIIAQDQSGSYRFNADLENARSLLERLDEIHSEYGQAAETAREPLKALYEDVFKHQSFTGRSGTMFGFEGLGCIYWHMVAKLLLAVQEQFFKTAKEVTENSQTQRLGELYYQIRKGFGFNKSPGEYGAFPHDPYSHTPKHAGARQPGMTGQVKEEVLTRFGELGLRVKKGRVAFLPRLLRKREFLPESRSFCYLDINGHWQDIEVSGGSLAFTWCQVPIIYTANNSTGSRIELTFEDGSTEQIQILELSAEFSTALFERTGQIRKIDVTFSSELLFNDQNCTS